MGYVGDFVTYQIFGMISVSMGTILQVKVY